MERGYVLILFNTSRWECSRKLYITEANFEYIYKKIDNIWLLKQTDLANNLEFTVFIKRSLQKTNSYNMIFSVNKTILLFKKLYCLAFK